MSKEKKGPVKVPDLFIENHNFIESIVSTTPDLIIIQEIHSEQVIYRNKNDFWNSFFNFNVDEIPPGERTERIIDPVYLSRAHEFIENRKKLDDDKVLQAELKLCTNGWIRIRSKIFKRDPNGHALQVISFITDISRTKIAEENFRNKYYQLKETQSIGRVGSFIWNLVTNVITWSDEMYRIYGIPKGEIVTPEKMISVIHPDDAGEAKKKLQECMEMPCTVNINHRLITPGGETKMVTKYLSSFEDEEGKISSITGSVHDVTEQKKAEHEILRLKDEIAVKATDKYHTLFNSMDEGYCIIQMLQGDDGKFNDWLYVEVNPAFEKHNGLVNATGKTIKEMVPDIEQKWIDIYGRVAETGESIRFQEGSDTLKRIFDLYAFRVGEPEECKVAVLFTDITERKKAEEDLIVSKTRLTALIEGVPTAICMVDTSGKIILSNQEMKYYLPENIIPSKDEASSARWKSWNAKGELVDRINYPSARALMGEEVVPGIEMLFTDQEGNQVWTLVSAMPIWDRKNEVIGAVSAIIDITHHKTAELSVREFNAQLEKEVSERTIQLNQTINQLESFNYIASHDLQEPLRKIRTYIELLNSYRFEDPAMNKYFNNIKDASVRMSQLIDSLLSYSRNTAGSDTFDMVDLNKILEDVQSDHEVVIKEKKARITIEKLPVIKAVPFQMHQVFTNFLGNSLKFCDKTPVIKVDSKIIDGKDIRPEPHPHMHDKKFAEIRFADNGIGFDPKYKDKIFELFQRLNPSSQYSGTGIGLSIVNKIIQQHNGYISVDGKLNEGAVFTVYLPV